MTSDVVVVGSLNMDLVVRSPRHPAPGETLLGSDFRTYAGGKGANQAVAASRMGGVVSMVGRVGVDDFGGSLLDNLGKAAIDATHVKRDPNAATGVALITVSADGQNTIVVAPGANGRVSPADVADAEEVIANASVLLLQLEVPIPAVLSAARCARSHGTQVILNPAPAASLPAELLRLVDILIPNQSELALLTGIADIESAAATLIEAGVPNVIVTLGAEGVLVVEPQRSTRIAAFPVHAVDTTAAGDAFVGAFGVALSQGRSVVDAAQWGNAAGAVAVTRAGAQPSLPTAAEVAALIALGHHS